MDELEIGQVEHDEHDLESKVRKLELQLAELKKDIPAKQGMAEAFDKPYKGEWEHGDQSHDMLVKLPDGSNLSIMFSLDHGAYGDEEWTVEFWRSNSQDVTGEGDQQRIFATVLNAIKKFINKYHPERMRFSANKDVEAGKSMSRTNLYNKLVQRYANSWGYNVDIDDFADTTVYNLQVMESRQGVAEAGGVGVVKGGNDSRYSTATMGAQNDVNGDTLGKEMEGFMLTGRKSPGASRSEKPVNKNVGKGVK
jgi:hypothetical protein